MSNNKKKKKGLGVDSFFDEPLGVEPQESMKPSNMHHRFYPPKKEKVRKTYVMYEETQLALEVMKFEELKRGNKISMSDLLEEAILDLMHKKGLTMPT